MSVIEMARKSIEDKKKRELEEAERLRKEREYAEAKAKRMREGIQATFLEVVDGIPGFTTYGKSLYFDGRRVATGDIGVKQLQEEMSDGINARELVDVYIFTLEDCEVSWAKGERTNESYSRSLDSFQRVVSSFIEPYLARAQQEGGVS